MFNVRIWESVTNEKLASDLMRLRSERSDSLRLIELEVTSWHQVLDIQIVMLMIICLYHFIELVIVCFINVTLTARSVCKPHPLPQTKFLVTGG